MSSIYEQLAAPFPGKCISWRVGSTAKTNTDQPKGLALAYIDARDVYARLDEVVGPQNWQCDYPHAASKTVCRIGLKVDGEWVWKANGAGDSDVEAEKGALSDALKRAAVCWGIGRYLYDLDSPWVQIEQRGKTWIIKDEERLRLARVAQQAYSDYWEGRERPLTAEEQKFLKHIADCENVAMLTALGEDISAAGLRDSLALREAWKKRKAEVGA